MWIVCLELEIAELDRLMSHITEASIARMHWLVVTERMDKLATLSTLWQSSTQVIPCHVPQWGPDIEGGVESILEIEKHLDSPAVVLKTKTTILSGELRKLPCIDFTPDNTLGTYFFPIRRNYWKNG
ncbi:hypothetical protein LP415_18970 [Polaromonas sp. P1(28)-8]|nr:hypothetical protein LP415_18970 [Polaromonas sp. P1(28)-8]